MLNERKNIYISGTHKDDRKVFIRQFVVEENFEAIMPCSILPHIL
jgi:hypothetical protein